MRYLITCNGHEPFYCEDFDPENHFNPALGMVVYDIFEQTYTKDGTTWIRIDGTHL